MTKRKREPLDPRLRSGVVGLAVMEAQVLHRGHVRLLSTMASDCDEGIVALGSCNKSGRRGHPFTYEQRKAMIETVFPGMFRFVQLNDIDTSDATEWCDYVIGRVTDGGLPRPCACYVGSVEEAKWYETRFDGRFDGVMTSDLRIVNRYDLAIPGARVLRDLIQMRDPSWTPHVPERLRAYVEWAYPPHLRVPLPHDWKTTQRAPHEARHPPGTLMRPAETGEPMLELKDDGHWRPVKVDAKERHAEGFEARRAQREGGAR